MLLRSVVDISAYSYFVNKYTWAEAEWEGPNWPLESVHAIYGDPRLPRP